MLTDCSGVVTQVYATRGAPGRLGKDSYRNRYRCPRGVPHPCSLHLTELTKMIGLLAVAFPSLVVGPARPIHPCMHSSVTAIIMEEKPDVKISTVDKSAQINRDALQRTDVALQQRQYEARRTTGKTPIRELMRKHEEHMAEKAAAKEAKKAKK